MLVKSVLAQFLHENWLLLIVIAGLVTAYLFLRTPADQMVSTDAFDRQVQTGSPTLVEFYSNT